MPGRPSRCSPATMPTIRSRSTMPAPVFQPPSAIAEDRRPGEGRTDVLRRRRLGGRLIEVALDRLAELGATIVPIPFADFHAVGALLYEGAWVAERYAAIKEMIEGRPESLHPVTRADHRRRDEALGEPGLRGHLQAEGAARGNSSRSGRSIDLLCVPSIPSPVHARRRRSRSDRREFAARHLYELRQPARSLRPSPCRQAGSPAGARSASR